MLPEAPSCLLSIAERMQKIRARMNAEKLSGVPAANKEVFLALCQEQESSNALADVQGKHEEVSGGNEAYWSDFGNWHDYPLFTPEMRKVHVS